MKLRDVVDLVIKGRDINLVTKEELSEDVQVQLQDIPWKAALEVILKTHNYSFVEQGKILSIQKMQDDSPSLTPHIVRLNYVDALAVKNVIEKMISKGGSVEILQEGGQDTQILSIMDSPQNLQTIKAIIPQLDAPPVKSIAKLEKLDSGKINLELEGFRLQELDKLLSDELGLNVFINGSLSGTARINLKNVPWQEALQLLLERHEFGFRISEEVVVIEKQDRIDSLLQTREYRLQYANGWDLKAFLEPMLSKGGSISCYAPSVRGGFEFGSKINEARTKKDSASSKEGRAKIISVTDHPEVLRRVEMQISSLDTRPRQIEVDVKIVQISKSKNKQIGIDWNTVLSISGAIRPTNLPFGSHSGSLFPGSFPDTGPSDFSFGALRADQLQAVLRMIDNRTGAEVISEPNITTLDNIEASILIGQKFPVTSETIDPQTAVRTVSLDYYENIGIQLLVVPTISADDLVHLVIHPAVNSLSELIEGRFPVIDTREADTQILLRSGDTAVIGGLIEHSSTKRINKVPFLGSIPYLGWLFSYESIEEDDTELVIFVTPRIVKEPEEMIQSMLVPADRKNRLREFQLRMEDLLREQE